MRFPRLWAKADEEWANEIANLFYGQNIRKSLSNKEKYEPELSNIPLLDNNSLGQSRTNRYEYAVLIL